MAEDLSDYERLRLENIKRNAQFLLQLGLPSQQPQNSAPRPSKQPAKRKTVNHSEPELPTRKSPRLSGASVVAPLVDEDIEEQEGAVFSYSNIPFESSDLDDDEFQIYVLLKAWRLETARKLEVEAYKVFQNRTLAVFIRQKRNDANWALPSKPNEVLEQELMECWGIGKAKAQEEGFGRQLNDYFYSHPSIEGHIAASLARGESAAAPANEVDNEKSK